MVKLKTIGKFSLLSVIFMAGVLVVSQLVSNTYAAQTLNGDNEIITINDTTDGLPINADISPIAYSGDGNVVLFMSSASNLRGAGFAGTFPSAARGLYTYNIREQQTKRIDVSTSGQLPSATPSGGVMSESGRYVIFDSRASNLIDGTTTVTNLGIGYLRDTQEGTTRSLGGNTTTNNQYNTDRFLGVSSDSRFILLASRYRGNTYPYSYRIGINDSGVSMLTFFYSTYGENEGGASATTKGSMSCDGSFVAYQKGSSLEFLDLRSGVQKSVTTVSSSVSPIVSCNGRYLLYATANRTDVPITPIGMDQYYHLVRYDRITEEREYIDNDSFGAFSVNVGKYGLPTEPPANIFSASIADTGDVVLNYRGNYYLKHLSDGSGTLEPIAKKTDGTYASISNVSWYEQGTALTFDGRFVFFMADPYTLGLSSAPSSKQLIRAKTGI